MIGIGLIIPILTTLSESSGGIKNNLFDLRYLICLVMSNHFQKKAISISIVFLTLICLIKTVFKFFSMVSIKLY